MSRAQLALNVPDIDEAADCSSKRFGTVPAEHRPAVADLAADVTDREGPPGATACSSAATGSR